MKKKSDCRNSGTVSMNTKVIHPKKELKGTFLIPGDKSISHRAIMLGSIANGTTEISHFLTGADCLSTIDCFRSMGIHITEKEGRILVHGKGLHGLKPPLNALNTKNSGTTTRLLCGILAGQPFDSMLSGDSSLNSRPMGRVITPLLAMGASIESTDGNGCAPLLIHPGKLHGIHYDSPVASAQVKSAILLAGLYADSATTVAEPFLSRNHTELMLQNFGASLTCTQSGGCASATVLPCEELCGQQILVPGDISSAAYFIAAALLTPHAEILLPNIGINAARAGFLYVCQKMGADITLLNKQRQCGELRADILVRESTLCGTTIAGNLIPTLIDEIPMLAVLAAFSKGRTIIRDAAELKVKETNRIDTVTKNLEAMGAHVTPTEDGMVIDGGAPLTGASIDSRLDHRIAMAFAIAGLAADGTTTILNSQCVDVSYPGFWDTGLF